MLEKARTLLYYSHFFSQFAESAWQFAVILFLSTITHNESFLLVSTYYLSTYASVLVFGAPLGRFVDQVNRLRAAQLCIWLQNGSVLMAMGCCCWLLTKKEHVDEKSKSDDTVGENVVPSDVLSIILIIGIHIFGSIAQVLDRAFVVAIERDWIVVMSQQVDKHEPISSEEEQATPDNSKAEEWLSATNVTMRQIDLACQVCAPAIAGLILGKALSEEATDSDHLTGLCDLQGATFLVGGLNLMALTVEYSCSAKVYYMVPALAVNKFSRRDNKQTKSLGYQSVEVSDEQTDRQESFEDEEDLDRTLNDTAKDLIVNGNPCCNSVIVYMQQPVALAGLSFAAIWVNSLSFGGFMTEYLLSREMPIEEVGIWRSIASFTGLLGTFAYQISTKYTSVVNTGQISVVYLFGCLSVAVASFLVEDNTLATYMLVVSCALSRVGLWVYDIVVTLLFQEFVPDGVRGLVGGTQNAFNSFGVVLVGVMGLEFRKPEDFYIFGAVSYFGSCTCAILYTVGVFRRGHKLEVLHDSR